MQQQQIHSEKERRMALLVPQAPVRITTTFYGPDLHNHYGTLIEVDQHSLYPYAVKVQGVPAVRYVRIDREALAAFLREQGVSEAKIKQLVIRIRPRVPKSYISEACRAETTLGVSRLNSVVVCTWQYPKNVIQLNNTLHHELYHFMTKGKYGPENYAMEYAKRPSEIAARTFAEQHSERKFLVLDLPPEQVQPAPMKMDQPVSIAPAAAIPSSPPRKRPVIAGIALALVGLGMVLLKPFWSQEVKHA